MVFVDGTHELLLSDRGTIQYQNLAADEAYAFAL